MTARIYTLRPRGSSMNLRAAANLASRLGGDAEAYGFTELAARTRQRARELDRDARIAERFERVAAGAAWVLERAKEGESA